MSLLLEALNIIKLWMDRHNPKFVEALQPALTREEIDEKICMLPFQFSEELYELYQWHDGDRDWGNEDSGGFVPRYNFLPLDEAISEYEDLMDLNATVAPDAWDSNHFPIFRWVGQCHYIVPCEQTITKSVAICVSDLTCGPPEQEYESLTEMMQVAAKACEMGAYYINDYGGLEADTYIMGRVWCNLYPEKVNAIVQQLQSFKQSQPKSLELFGEIQILPDPRIVELLLRFYEQESYQTDRWRQRIAICLLNFDDLKAIEIIISVLKQVHPSRGGHVIFNSIVTPTHPSVRGYGYDHDYYNKHRSLAESIFFNVQYLKRRESLMSPLADGFIELIEAYLEQGDAFKSIVGYAIRGLGELGSSKAEAILNRCLAHSEDSAFYARGALEKIRCSNLTT